MQGPASASRSMMLSTMPLKRGWHEKTKRAPAALSALAMYQAKLSLSPTPVTSAILPLKSMGTMRASFVFFREETRVWSSKWRQRGQEHAGGSLRKDGNPVRLVRLNQAASINKKTGPAPGRSGFVVLAERL